MKSKIKIIELDPEMDDAMAAMLRDIKKNGEVDDAELYFQYVLILKEAGMSKEDALVFLHQVFNGDLEAN